MFIEYKSLKCKGSHMCTNELANKGGFEVRNWLQDNVVGNVTH